MESQVINPATVSAPLFSLSASELAHRAPSIYGRVPHEARSEKYKLFGTPEIIIKNGKIDESKMLKNRFTLDELMQELRTSGLLNASTIEYGVLETNGKLNIILKADEQPLTPKLMNISAESPGYAHIIINEGRIISKNLKLLGRDENWLYKELKKQKINSPQSVYLFTLSDNGNVFCQPKENCK